MPGSSLFMGTALKETVCLYHLCISCQAELSVLPVPGNYDQLQSKSSLCLSVCPALLSSPLLLLLSKSSILVPQGIHMEG